MAAVMEVDELLRQRPRPTLAEACAQVAPRYNVAATTIREWRDKAIHRGGETLHHGEQEQARPADATKAA